MHTIEEARAAALALVQPTATEDVAVVLCRDRTLREELVAAFDVPAAPTSMMDGYAIVAGVGGDRGVVEESAAGAPSTRTLRANEAAPISTGALLPPGADAVVPIEDTQRDGANVRIPSANAGQFVRNTGSDLRAGEALLHAGERLDAIAIALLAGQGRAHVRVAREPRVAIFSLGAELREPGTPLPPGALYDSNGPALAAACEEVGARAELMPVVPDELAALTAALAHASADLIVTSGGASVGVHDHLRAAIEQAGGEVILWRVAMKPGKPLVLGRIGATAVIGVPGNPVSALVSFYMFVRPVLLTLLARDTVDLPRRTLKLAAPLPPIGARRELVRAKLVDGALVPEARQSSSSLLALHHADALIDCVAHARIAIGDHVEAFMLRAG